MHFWVNWQVLVLIQKMDSINKLVLSFCVFRIFIILIQPNYFIWLYTKCKPKLTSQEIHNFTLANSGFYNHCFLFFVLFFNFIVYLFTYWICIYFITIILLFLHWWINFFFLSFYFYLLIFSLFISFIIFFCFFIFLPSIYFLFCMCWHLSEKC